MMTAALYARVSSARQKAEQTIASQTAALRAHASETGLDVPPEWVFEDEGYSGATLIRPGLERLRDLAAEIELPVVLCYAPDRLARRYAYQVLLIEEFARVGTELRFLKGRKSQTPEDELLLQFQGMIAEYERAQIAERTRRGKRHRARCGSPAVLSGAPYGYRYVRKSEATEARYDIIEREACVVRELFRRYVEENESIAGLVRYLGDRLSHRFGKVRVWSAALCVKVVVFAGLVLVGAGDWLLIGSLTVVFGAATGASAVLGPSLKADVVDSDEAATGERKEGTFFAAWGLAIKAAIGCAILLSGFVLSSTGFRPNVAQTSEALFGIRALVSIFPLLCHLVALALLRRFDLDEAAHAEIRGRIRIRRATTGPLVLGENA